MHSHRASTAVALAGMLFLQAAIGLVACERPARAAAIALAMAPSAAHARHDGARRDSDLCFVRCGNQDQTPGKAQFHLPDLAMHPGPLLRVAAQEAAPLAQYSVALAPAAGPPPRILFQSFLL